MERQPTTPSSTPPSSSTPSPRMSEKFVAFQPPIAPDGTPIPQVNLLPVPDLHLDDTPEPGNTAGRKAAVAGEAPGASRRRSSLSPPGSPRRPNSYISLTHTDDTVIYSDSDNASQSSADWKLSEGGISTGNSLSPPRIPKKRKMKKKVRKSSDSEQSRSSIRHSLGATERGDRFSEVLGTGYTSVPATGKIFRNLLILEDNLRQQVNQQKHLRRKYLIFLACLCSMTASISHHLFLVDTTPTGTKRVVLQFTLLALLVTLMLYHLSGEYQKTIVVPRKFLSSTNKGLRQLNVRLVKIKTSMSDSLVDSIREFGLFIGTMCLSSLHKVYPSTFQNNNSKLEVFLVSCQSYCQARVGINDVKLVLNSRAFNIDVREGWELYRSEFWIHEGVRRRKNLLAFAQKKDKKRRKSSVKPGGTPGSLSPGVLSPRRMRSPSPSKPRLSEQNLQSLNKLNEEY